MNRLLQPKNRVQHKTLDNKFNKKNPKRVNSNGASVYVWFCNHNFFYYGCNTKSSNYLFVTINEWKQKTNSNEILYSKVSMARLKANTRRPINASIFGPRNKWYRKIMTLYQSISFKRKIYVIPRDHLNQDWKCHAQHGSWHQGRKLAYRWSYQR